MKTFVFLLTFWYADGRPPEVYVEGSGLSGADCIALVLAYDGPARASCEIDEGV